MQPQTKHLIGGVILGVLLTIVGGLLVGPNITVDSNVTEQFTGSDQNRFTIQSAGTSDGVSFIIFDQRHGEAKLFSADGSLSRTVEFGEIENETPEAH